ncbi:hypothetical protein V8C86DRAFT_3029827 [Haematococcus lacustris]
MLPSDLQLAITSQTLEQQPPPTSLPPELDDQHQDQAQQPPPTFITHKCWQCGALQQPGGYPQVDHHQPEQPQFDYEAELALVAQFQEQFHELDQALTALQPHPDPPAQPARTPLRLFNRFALLDLESGVQKEQEAWHDYTKPSPSVKDLCQFSERMVAGFVQEGIPKLLRQVVGEDPVVWSQDPVGQDPVVRCHDPVDPVCQDPVVRDQDPVVPGPCHVVPGPCWPGPCGEVPGPCGARTLWTLWYQDPVVWYQDPVVWCQDPVCQNPVVRCQDPVGVQQDPVVRYQDPVVPEPCGWAAVTTLYNLSYSHFMKSHFGHTVPTPLAKIGVSAPYLAQQLDTE